MAKSISADKRENEKKRLARRAEKQKKKEEKKLSNKANSFEDMIAYVDENGMITSTPPAENNSQRRNKAGRNRHINSQKRQGRTGHPQRTYRVFQ